MLAPADLDDARRVAGRLLTELAELLQSVPLERRPVSALSRWLDVSRPVCQRVTLATRHRGDALRGLIALPGVQGLVAFLHAFDRAAGDAPALAAVRAATAAYADLVERTGGSQARLVAALEAHLEGEAAASAPRLAPADDGAAAAARRRIFEGARDLTGREVGVQVGVFVYRPQPDAPERIDCLTALALLGARMREHAMPISPISTFAYGEPDASADDVVVRPLGQTDPKLPPVGVLEAFCSRPAPTVLARRREGRVSLLVEPAAKEEPFDVALGARFLGVPHPALHVPRMQTCHVHCDVPALRLVMCVHMHRSMALRSEAMTGAYVRERLGVRMPAPNGRIHVLTPAELWAERLPDPPRLEYLGRGFDGAPSAEPRAEALVRHLMDSEGWSPEEFIGWRIQVAYPTWNAQHVIHFDFPDDADPAAR